MFGKLHKRFLRRSANISGYEGTAAVRPASAIWDVYVRGLGSSPARINRRTGERQLNIDIFPYLPPAWQRFIQYHEEGHYVLQTTNEEAADEYAFYKWAPEGWPLHQAIPALTRILDERNPDHQRRVELQDRRVRQYDYYVNGNFKALA